MIILVHGTDTTKSYNLILSQQQKYNIQNVIHLDITETTPNELYEKIRSTSLFGDKPFVICNVTNSTKDSVAGFIKIITETPQDTVLILYATKTLSKTNEFLKLTQQDVNIKMFHLEKTFNGNAFRFIDYVFSKDRTQSYKELKTLVDENNDEFYIFSMLLYQLRQIAKVKFNTPSSLELKSFQISKLNTYCSKFSEHAIQNIYSYLYKIDKKVKLGEITPELMVTMAVEKVLNS